MDDPRWVQRFASFCKACDCLNAAVELSMSRALSDLEKLGLVNYFECAHELAWKTLKDFFEFRGVQEIYGSVDATRVAFREGVIADGEVWMQMIEHRNLTSHTYHRELASKIATAIAEVYFTEFEKLRAKLEALRT